MMEFSINLDGCVTRFSIKKKNVVLKDFDLPEMHFKANLFSPIITPPSPHPRDYLCGDTKRGEEAHKAEKTS